MNSVDNTPTWAQRLASEIDARMQHSRNAEAHLISVRAVATERVELIFTLRGDGDGARGISVEKSSLENAATLFQDRSVAEIAFLVINVGVLEPKETSAFKPSDDSGVRWLAQDEWLDGLT